ncbi:MAG: hypothetical protein LBK29_03520 [Oscillospiraceae bacterium]|jgi:glutaredoxin|nr:hypothetical protein [Oscillospiraceae bacterium]
MNQMNENESEDFNIVLYSTGCPKCKVLEKKLKDKGIQFKESKDTNKLLKRGFARVPVLEVEGEFLNFYDANNWINQQINY